MSKTLAIKGHPTRGKEVIELLEMMGGKNYSNIGNDDYFFYYINDENNIEFGWTMWDNNPLYTIFTLEEFLEKYPFKVGDRVRIPEYESEVRICQMKWNPLCEYMEYMVYRNDDEEWYTAVELLNYNDVETKENDMGKTGYTLNELIDLLPLTSDSVMIAVRDGFEIIEEQGKFFLKRKKPTYPTTYEECCEILGIGSCFEPEIRNATAEECRRFTELIRLKRCRDTYWKIAGEEMGLGKPWEPDWGNDDETKFCIYTTQNIISLDIFGVDNRILAFPSEEMRDVFYENFKDLIETCSELL